MDITVLTENRAGGKLLAEHGLSYLIEIDGEAVLFDTGHSDVFLKNAAQLGVELQESVKKIVLSHGHWDHGDGLKYLKNKTLITHPGSFVERFRKTDRSAVGLSFSRDEVIERFELIETKKPFRVTVKLFFLGEIPRKNSFESLTTPFELVDGTDDFIPDDSALAAIVGRELVVVTGCSHSGICNICEQAKRVTGIGKISAVIGGFHLKKQNRQTFETIRYFEKNKIKRVLPSHCTDLPALAAFYESFKIEQVKTGDKFSF